MLDSIITSEARIKLLIRFFVNPKTKAYLRELSDEFHCSSNSIRVELNRLEKASLLVSEKRGRNVYYCANTEHPLFPEINSMSKKVVGIDKLHEIVSEIGNVESAYLMGALAKGSETAVLDLLLVGDVDKGKLEGIITKVEGMVKKKIRTLLLSSSEFSKMDDWLKEEGLLLIWNNGLAMGGA
ncbi:MAG: ArsR family transcriptional regulator [Pseudomonadota bacterium]